MGSGSAEQGNIVFTIGTQTARCNRHLGRRRNAPADTTTARPASSHGMGQPRRHHRPYRGRLAPVISPCGGDGDGRGGRDDDGPCHGARRRGGCSGRSPRRSTMAPRQPAFHRPAQKRGRQRPKQGLRQLPEERGCSKQSTWELSSRQNCPLTSLMPERARRQVKMQAKQVPHAVAALFAQIRRNQGWTRARLCRNLAPFPGERARPALALRSLVRRQAV